MISVLYVDDEPNLLEITKLFIEKDGDIIVDTGGACIHGQACRNSQLPHTFMADRMK